MGQEAVRTRRSRAAAQVSAGPTAGPTWGLRIVLYTRAACAGSRAEKAWLAANALRFEERDVELDPAWLAELIDLGSRGTPTTVVEWTRHGRAVVIVGFLRGHLAEVLGLPPDSRRHDGHARGA